MIFMMTVYKGRKKIAKVNFVIKDRMKRKNHFRLSKEMQCEYIFI